MSPARPDLLRRSIGEALAACALVFAGCGAAITNATHDAVLGQTGVAAVFGLIIMVMIYATGHLSGAHINPAVTIAFTLTRHFPLRDAVAYTAAQLTGATAGALLLLAIWTDKPAALGATVPSIAVGSALVYEIVLTAFLMFVIIAVATDTRAVGSAAAIAIGGTVALDAFRRTTHRRLDEPGPLHRPRARLRRVDPLLDLYRRTADPRSARGLRLPVHSHARHPARLRAGLSRPTRAVVEGSAHRVTIRVILRP